MELRDYLAIVGRRKWLILMTLVVVTVIAATVTAFRAAVYTATTTIQVATPASVGNANVVGSTDYNDRLQSTYSEARHQRPDARRDRAEAQAELAPEDLRQDPAEHPADGRPGRRAEAGRRRRGFETWP